jgi:hypothetical protein
MTSQVLTPGRLSNLSESQTIVRSSNVEARTASASTSSSSSSVAVLESVKLPYQVDHQVELLHLRAEVEALLQQLQSLKQQRLVSTPTTSDN